MKKILLISFLTAITIFSLFSKSQPEPLNLDDLIALTLKSSLDLETEHYRLKVKRWRMLTGWNVLLPEGRIEAGFTRLNSSESRQHLEPVGPIVGDAYGVLPSQSPPREWEFSLLLELGVKLNASHIFHIRQTVLEWQEGKVALEECRRRIIAKVRELYYESVLLEESANVIAQEFLEAERIYLEAKDRVEKGYLAPYSLINAELEYDQLRMTLDRLELERRQMERGLRELIGVREPIKILYDDSILELPAVAIDIEQAPGDELELYRMAIKKKRNRRNYHVSLLTPSLYLGYSADIYFMQDAEYQWFGDSDYMRENWSTGRSGLHLGLKLPLGAWMPFSKEQMDIVYSNLAVEQAERLYQRKAIFLEEQRKMEQEELSRELELVSRLKKHLELAKRGYSLTLEGYEKGSISLLEVQQMRSNYSRAEIGYLQAVLKLRCRLEQ